VFKYKYGYYKAFVTAVLEEISVLHPTFKLCLIIWHWKIPMKVF